MKTTIDDRATGRFTLINTFTVEPENAPHVVASLEGFTKTVASTMSGFVAASVHVSKDKTRVINYVQWESDADFRAMFADPRSSQHMSEVGSFATRVDPVVYDVVYVGSLQPSDS